MSPAITAPPLLSIESLSVDLALPHGRLHVLSDIDLQVRRGQTLCIVGESGCGKTMTSLAVLGLLPRSARRLAGRAMFGGQDLLALPEREMARLRGDRIAMVFQDPMTALNPVLTIGRQLTEGYLRHGKGSRRAALDRATQLLARVGIANPAERLQQHPHELSGGLRQRVLIAMALMCEPHLLVADEPTTALDVTVQAQVLALLRELQREMNLGLLLVTHDLSVVANVADRVAVMYAGRVVETGSAEQVLRDPRHPYTHGLLACLPLRGRVRRGEPLGTIPGMMAALTGSEPGCRFAPRCAHAMPVCLTAAGSRLHALPGDRSARCVLADPALGAVGRADAVVPDAAALPSAASPTAVPPLAAEAPR